MAVIKPLFEEVVAKTNTQTMTSSENVMQPKNTVFFPPFFKIFSVFFLRQITSGNDRMWKLNTASEMKTR